MHVAATAIIRMTANGHTHTVIARPDEALVDIVLRGCCGKLGITKSTTCADIAKQRLVITAGTKAYNMSFADDLRATV